MVISSAILKALVGIVATGAVASSIGTTIAYRESLFGSNSSSNTTDTSDLKERCYVIPTEESKQGKQLLVCKKKDSEKTGIGMNDYLYSEGSGRKNTKVKTIKKKEDNLEISLEGNDTQEKTNLKVTGGNWNKIQNLEDLNDCELTPNGEGATFQCINGSAMQDIKLSKFQG